jgi:HlyD family secretion protein
MRRLFVIALILALVAGAWAYVERPWAQGTAETPYRTARVDRGGIVAAVSATGTINPVATVIVGSQLSGQVVEVLADYNDRVAAGQVLARLNSDQIRARLDAARADLAQARAQAAMQEANVQKNRSERQRAQATLADVEAQVRRAEAQAADAERTLTRTADLARRAISTEVQLQTARLASETTRAAVDSARAQVRSNEAQILSLDADAALIAAQLASAVAAVQQREAVIRQIEVDLRNTEIRSPVQGVVVQRSVELGQTVAASMTAPTLFLVAEDLRTMRIFANVDETDVGRVRPGQPVTFAVNAFPGREFRGRVEQVRLGSTTVQNVVIYTAVVTVENPDNVLLPGMTANLRVLTEERRGVLRVPNAALRWRPPSEAPAALGPGPAANPFGGQPPLAGPPGGGAGGGGRGGQGGGPMAEFVQQLRSELRLTAAQSAELDAVLADARAEARTAAQGGGGGQPGARREAFARMREQVAERIAALLTPEQQPRFAELRERLAAERGGGPAGRVFVVGEDGAPRPVAVRLGASDGALTEVVGARLAEGAEVIVGGGPRAGAGQQQASGRGMFRMGL